LSSTWEEDLSEEDAGGGDLGEAEMTQRSLLPATIERSESRQSRQRSPTPQQDEQVGTEVQEIEMPHERVSGADPPNTAPVGGQPRMGSLSRRGWGEAPTYLEAMSSPAFPQDHDLEAGVPPPRTPGGTIRERTTSSFRELLSRAGWTPGSHRGLSTAIFQRRSSQTSLLLQPQSSRMSALSMGSARGTSPYPSPWASTHSLVISSPLPNTAVRASFDSTRLPRAGLSEQQMRFLSSSEAVQTAGISLADPPRGRRRRSEAAVLGESLARSRSGSSLDEAPPPTWEEIDEERRQTEAETRRGLARPVERGIEGEEGSMNEAEQADAEGLHEDERNKGTGAAEEAGVLQVEPREPVANGLKNHLSSPGATIGSSSPLTPGLAVEPPTPISPQHVVTPV
jgi:hypothetical protein